ncbi:magnesium transporter NIPA1-like, partial [Lethenteron reissneri]|uniref:magnesium transporter NIPA1-like n=1 Tax=Lethenteron reissneri TaxID=7753 RepID=UPI002AB5F3E2
VPAACAAATVRAVLASWLLGERLSPLGKLGCVLCCVGCIEIIIHTPKGSEVKRLAELEDRLTDPVFWVYVALVLLALLALVRAAASPAGSSDALVPIAICSLFGSFTVPSAKGLGLAVSELLPSAAPPGAPHATRLALAAAAVLAVSLPAQLRYLTRALAVSSSATVVPVYYAGFTVSVTAASSVLFREWAGASAVAALGAACGFVTVCAGVVLVEAYRDGDPPFATPAATKARLTLGGSDDGPIWPISPPWTRDAQWPRAVPVSRGSGQGCSRSCHL